MAIATELAILGSTLSVEAGNNSNHSTNSSSSSLIQVVILRGRRFGAFDSFISRFHQPANKLLQIHNQRKILSQLEKFLLEEKKDNKWSASSDWEFSKSY